MSIDLQRYECINTHLAFKLYNHEWIQKCLNDEPSAFPHRIVENGKATFDPFNFVPTFDSHENPSGTLDGSPAYLINIPLAYRNLKKNPDLFSSLLKLFKEEAFGANAAESAISICQRTALVIGINHPNSLDQSVNDKFLNTIVSLPCINNIAYRAFGFFWYPEWKNVCGMKSELYSPQKGYALLKAFSNDKAYRVLALVEGTEDFCSELTSQIPFQRIREQIKDSSMSRFFASYFEHHAPQSPLYLGIMDPDCHALRTQRIGLLSRIDAVVLAQNAPSAISCGYQLKSDEPPLRRLGVKTDMFVRAAMNQIIAYAAYFPEPASFFCIRHPPGSHILLSLSFIGNGHGLENRRLIQNARLKKLFDDRAVFLNCGGVVTGTPGRMKTKKNQKITELSAKVLKQKAILQTIRGGVSQTHATPKQWADNLYIALDFSYPRVTDVTTPMMYIFSVFDPISRMLSIPGRFTIKNFDQVMQHYHEPLSDGQKNLLDTAKTRLRIIGMPEDKIALVEQAASASGEAIYQVLSQAALGII